MRLGALKRRGGRAALWLIVGLLVGGTVGALGAYFLKRGKNGVPGGPRLGTADEVSLIPGEASGFIHVRLRDVWHTDGFAEFRKIVEKAGPKALADLDQSFVPAPTTLDRMTLVFVTVPPPPNVAPPPKGKQPNEPRKNAQPPKGGQPGKFPPQPPIAKNPPPPTKKPGDPGAGGVFDKLDNFDFVPSAKGDVRMVVILAFREPYDANKVRDTYLKGAAQKSIGSRSYWDDSTGDLAGYFPDDKVLVLGDSTAMKTYLTKLASTPPATGAPLASAIELAREGGRHVVAALNVAQFGVNATTFTKKEGDTDPVAKELTTVFKAESIALTLALGEETKVEVRAKYKDDESATASEAALRNLAKIGREKLAEPKKQMEETVNGKPGEPKPRPIKELPMAIAGLLGLGSINALDEWLANPPLETKGSEVILTPKAPSIATAYAGAAALTVGLMVPAVDKVREAAARMGGANNLSQIGIAFHDYNDRMRKLPANAWTQKTGEQPKPGGLSWRVHLLPDLGEDALYKQFHLDEPWDSDHNKKLVEKMPRVYASPSAPAAPGLTFYKVCTGPNALFDFPQKYSIQTIRDGTSNTIMVIEGGAPVTWTKPDDFVIGANKLPDMKLNGNSRINVLLADGSVRNINLSTLSETNLRNAINPEDGENLPADWGQEK